MKLKKLLRGISQATVKGSKEVEITGLSLHSKLVKPGHLFIAKRGFSDDGARYINEAVISGAKAVVTDIHDPFLKNVTQVIHPDPAAIETKLAQTFFDDPSKQLFTIGITGTNGKTTVSYLIKHLLDAEGDFCGLIGTIEYIVGKQHFPATLTTPDSVTLQGLLAEVRKSRYPAVVMEASSHGLKQGRAEGIDFDVGVFTNFSRDHLDYHQNMESYLHAKGKLFRGLGAKQHAILNRDIPEFDELKAMTKSQVLTYGIEKNADLRAFEISLGKKYTNFAVTYKGEKAHVKTKLIGRFNIYNILCAIAVGLLRNFPLVECAAAISTFRSVPGRLESIPNREGVSVFVDFAHSDDALKNILTTLQEIKQGKIITVFGCGGNRDQTKRSKMAQTAEQHSDFSIITSDNPRKEDPLSICLEVAAGFSKKKNYTIEVDRKKAIEKAIQTAEKGDIVLIAGKGHENTQILEHKTVPFDDKEVAQEALKNLH